ncbi:phosphoribosyl 1,2-cyclic phosphate phosphodiesterase [Alkalispirochaeta americana]|uniref:Phosphoribosyl 1,2-cyclic phosphate phosphodiesterase n=1 Tax=Alkalispirochaeta americana TaxID=159291 RepID=A0A1N6T2M3_9SPIO|nr:MBL fold metallo-hydrolase [Alkalispirochaeta americana]SIQ47580.1 phosphoribosyl 1,2-cyclic phosphate phosphodiesterase [Alkalispirochaeta americana]
MDIRFLGTAASPAMPLPFCVCAGCKTARKEGGKNVRRRSACLVNTDLLLDLGPDVPSAAASRGWSLTRVELCLQTHPHADHFDPELLISRHPEWGGAVRAPLVFAGSRKTLEALDAVFQRQCDYGSLLEKPVQEVLSLEITELEPFREISRGRYSIIPYPANHAREFDSLVYAVSDGEKSLFYGTDTAGIDSEVWDHMVARGRAFDAVVLDQTYGLGFPSSDHLSAEGTAAAVSRFRELGLLAPGSCVFATHLSHEGILEHNQMERWALERGYNIAYDGLMLTL